LAVFFTLIFVSYSNIAEVPLTFENKRIVQRQLSNGAYPAFSYVLALIVVQLPIILLADMILSLAIYWMVGFVSSAGNFFFFYFVIGK
jgi:ATP-binding cassette, subfamily G (WHITE), member 2, SNQ2